MKAVRQVLGQGAFAILVFAVLAVSQPLRAQAETLADALVSAYNHSGLLDQNRALLRAADEDVALANSALLPVVRWTASLSKDFSRRRTAPFFNRTSDQSATMSINLIAEYLLFDFGASQYRVESTKETVLATRQSLLNVEQQVLFRTVQAYMGVIEANEIVALRNNNLRLLTQELRAARDRFEVGEVTRTDVALAEAQLANARSGVAAGEGDLLHAVEEFRNAVGRAPGRLTPPPRLPNISNDINAAKGEAVRHHPLIRSAQHQVSAAEWLVKASEAAMNPRVTLNGQLGVTETFGDQADSQVGSVGLNLSQTIYQGGNLSASLRKAMAQRDAQRANLHVVRHNLEQDVGNAYANLRSARAQLEASERQIRAARIAFRGVREEATLGARTTLDVLDSEQALLDAETNRVSARSLLYVAAYAVLFSTGRLTAEDLKLPVQIYDPESYYNIAKDSPALHSAEGRKLDRVLRALGKQ